VVSEAVPAVVSVITEIVAYDLFRQEYTQSAAGSGIILDSDGFIVTNNHVVQNAEEIQVELADGRSYPARIIGTDTLTDLAVLKVEATELPYAHIGDSGRLAVGDWVVAIGNALGEGISATEGIVSRLGVSITVRGNTLRDLIQTTAAVNPGNSGGPLVDMHGEVIGINSVKVAEVGVEGMSYAISVNSAQPVIEDLVHQGYVTRPWLGVSLYTVDRIVAMMNDLSVDQGALVVEVADGSPATRAGLKKGDVIVEFEGKRVRTVDDVLQSILDSEIGAEVEIGFVRGDERHSTTAQLQESPSPWQ
jgi:serine protease Do